MLAVLYGGIGVVNIQIESLAFGISSLSQTARDTALQLIPVVLASAVLAVGMTRGVPPDTVASRLQDWPGGRGSECPWFRCRTSCCISWPAG